MTKTSGGRGLVDAMRGEGLEVNTCDRKQKCWGDWEKLGGRSTVVGEG